MCGGVSTQPKRKIRYVGVDYGVVIDKQQV